MNLQIGQRIEFIRHGHPFGPIIHGYVISLTGDDDAPAKVRNNGRVYVPPARDYVPPRLVPDGGVL